MPQFRLEQPQERRHRRWHRSQRGAPPQPATRTPRATVPTEPAGRAGATGAGRGENALRKTLGKGRFPEGEGGSGAQGSVRAPTRRARGVTGGPARRREAGPPPPRGPGGRLARGGCVGSPGTMKGALGRRRPQPFPPPEVHLRRGAPLLTAARPGARPRLQQGRRAAGPPRCCWRRRPGEEPRRAQHGRQRGRGAGGGGEGEPRAPPCWEGLRRPVLARLSRSLPPCPAPPLSPPPLRVTRWPVMAAGWHR